MLATIAAAILPLASSPVVADTVTLTIEYNDRSLSWDLYAQIVDTGTPNSGDAGLAAVRALIDNVNAPSIALAPDIGAVPLPAQVTGGGTVDLIYLQNLAVPASVVPGVGVGSPRLIASGLYTALALPPAFGNDDFGQTTDGNFLNPTGANGYGQALAWGGVTLLTVDVSPPGQLGDFNSDGTVDLADYTVWRDNLGTNFNLSNNGTEVGASQGLVDEADYILWKSRFGASASFVAPTQAVNEVLSIQMAVAVILSRLCGCGFNRRGVPTTR